MILMPVVLALLCNWWSETKKICSLFCNSFGTDVQYYVMVNDLIWQMKIHFVNCDTDVSFWSIDFSNYQSLVFVALDFGSFALRTAFCFVPNNNLNKHVHNYFTSLFFSFRYFSFSENTSKQHNVKYVCILLIVIYMGNKRSKKTEDFFTAWLNVCLLFPPPSLSLSPFDAFLQEIYA